MANYTIDTYKEERRPSDDASSVGRWIITPSILAAALGGGLFGGLAGTIEFTGAAWVFSFLLFGGGLLGLGVMAIRFVTYDKQPFISIRETTQNPIDDTMPKPQYRGGNNAPDYVQERGDILVEFASKQYAFSAQQIRLMLDRVTGGNKIVAQNEFKIAPGAEYKKVCDIMGGLGYWQVTKKSGKTTAVRWRDDGVKWLMSQTR